MSGTALEDLLVALLLRGSLVMLAGWSVTLCLARASAAARHLVWAVTVTVLLALPCLLQLRGIELAILPGAADASSLPAPAARQRAVERLLRVVPVAEPATLRTLAPAASQVRRGGIWPAVYGAGVAAVLAHLLVGLGRSRRLTRGARAIDLETGLPRRAGRGVSIRLAEGLDLPFTWGFRRPVIVLPAAARRWQPADRERALLHELAHVERGDWLVQLITRIACAIYWFHPLVWWIARSSRLEAERAADDRVLLCGGDSLDYARQLISLARTARLDRATSRAVLALSRRDELSTRIRAILDPALPRRTMTRAARLRLALSTSLALALLATLHLRPAAATPVPMELPPLIDAAATGDLATVRRLLADGEDPNLAVMGRGTPLILAAGSGREEIVRLLLDGGADANRAVRGDGNPLIGAAGSGRLEVVRLLVDSGADIDGVVPGDENPLIQAASAGHLDVVSFLIEQGADVDIRVRANLYEIRTPLGEAVRGGHLDVADRLRSAGAVE